MWRRLCRDLSSSHSSERRPSEPVRTLADDLHCVHKDTVGNGLTTCITQWILLAYVYLMLSVECINPMKFVYICTCWSECNTWWPSCWCMCSLTPCEMPLRSRVSFDSFCESYNHDTDNIYYMYEKVCN